MNSPHPICLAVTGGIACGKSSVGHILAANGWKVLDCDFLAHELMQKGRPVYVSVVKRFGADILDESGEISREKLGRKVFADAGEREALNKTVHPAVMEAAGRWIQDCRDANEDCAVLVPLLFETGWTEGWDAVLCVRADPETVFHRLEKRGLSRQAARRRVESQMPLDEKEKRADFTIENNTTPEELETRMCGLLENLRSQTRTTEHERRTAKQRKSGSKTDGRQ